MWWSPTYQCSLVELCVWILRSPSSWNWFLLRSGTGWRAWTRTQNDDHKERCSRWCHRFSDKWRPPLWVEERLDILKWRILLGYFNSLVQSLPTWLYYMTLWRFKGTIDCKHFILKHLFVANDPCHLIRMNKFMVWANNKNHLAP